MCIASFVEHFDRNIFFSGKKCPDLRRMRLVCPLFSRLARRPTPDAYTNSRFFDDSDDEVADVVGATLVPDTGRGTKVADGLTNFATLLPETTWEAVADLLQEEYEAELRAGYYRQLFNFIEEYYYPNKEEEDDIDNTRTQVRALFQHVKDQLPKRNALPA
jgi:hypothetical protein